jgi:hypothetical protein
MTDGMCSRRTKGIQVVEQRKQAISIRLASSDVRNLKRIAKRLGVRDSDIVRYALRSMFGRLGPLGDEGIAGRNLLPVLVESGDELIRYFDLDAYRLENIINHHAEADLRVDREDIALLAMSGLRDEYLLMRTIDGNGVYAETGAQARSLRTYLYEKYVYRSAEIKGSAEAGAQSTGEGRRGTVERPAA